MKCHAIPHVIIVTSYRTALTAARTHNYVMDSPETTDRLYQLSTALYQSNVGNCIQRTDTVDEIEARKACFTIVFRLQLPPFWSCISVQSWNSTVTYEPCWLNKIC